MQHIGPPPSYLHLKIPGLNAPLPPGAKTGMHPGGWGHPPLDPLGRPLFGGDWNQPNNQVSNLAEPIDKTSWGVIEINEDSDEDTFINVDDDMDEDGDAMQNENISSISNPEFESGTVSVGGFETPESIDLRKQKLEKESEDTMMHYDEPERVIITSGIRKEKMDVSLDPSELDTEDGITED